MRISDWSSDVCSSDLQLHQTATRRRNGVQLMTAQQSINRRAFPDEALARFQSGYPDAHVKLSHTLHGHSLFTREALARLAERLPIDLVEYNRGDLPLGVWPEDTPENGLSISETIKDIDSNGSWMVLKNVERDRDYASL